MTVSDLKIGNLVTIDNPVHWPKLKGIPLKVTGIDSKMYELFPKSTGAVSLTLEDNLHPAYDAYYDQFDEFIQPIPLAEEWLLKFGFERVPHLNITNAIIKNIGRNRIISIGCVGTPNEMIWLCEINATDSAKIDDLVCLRNFDYDGATHIHQLQNLFFSLTGKELVASI